MKLTNSPIEKIQLFNQDLFIKRDDLLHPEFSGNKARKFKYFLDQEFKLINNIVGFGSCQANSLYSLSALAKLRGWSCTFFVDRIPKHLETNPLGNYAAALNNGTQISLFENEELSNDDQKEAWLYQKYANCNRTIIIPEGGRSELASYGVHELASEIIQWVNINEFDGLNVFLPSGTGTTSLFLQDYFSIHKSSINVLTCAVVGDEQYLKKQFTSLIPDETKHPKILHSPHRFHFGKLNKKLLDIWIQANRSGVEFELLYDPVGLITLENHINTLTDLPILYIHQGGIKANETMLPRYERKYGSVD